MRTPFLSKGICTIVLTFFLFAFVQAQSYRDFEAGVFLGLGNSQGDVVPAQFYTFQANSFAYGLFVKKYFNPYAGLRLSYYNGEISGDDEQFDVRDERFARFTTSLQELSLRLEVDAIGDTKKEHIGWSPYGFVGLGLTVFEPSTDYGLYETAEFAQGWVAEDKMNLDAQQAVAIPLGIGIKNNLKNGLNFGIELGYRWAFTDYLDGISQAGNPDNDDSYFFGGLTISKRMSLVKDSDNDSVNDKKDECPDVAGLPEMAGCPDTDTDGVADKDDDCPNIAGLAQFAGCPDTDGDGVKDEEDDCPGVAGLAQFKGCPDTDGDGVIDRRDRCPEQKGSARFRGCPDTDGDGVGDDEDRCPNKAGELSNRGCPENDADDDGVPDSVDNCPDQPGSAQLKGCPDGDGDGVADKDDQCPKRAGLARYQGCPDSDGDGVPDPKDLCPDRSGPANNDGCPEIKKEDRDTLAFAMQNVNFRSGRAQLLTASFDVLDKIANILNKYPDYRLRIEGHTDSDGKAANNLRLSEQRAAACRDYLLTKGIEPSRITSVGYGETRPIADNNTKAGKSLNRRVAFDVYLK